MKTITANLIYQYPAELGEGALWDTRLSRLWWVNITKGHLHRYDPKTNVNETFEIGSPVGAFVPEDGKDIALAIKNGFASYDTKSGKLEMLAEIKHANPNIRFNDGKCDPEGRFWAGTMDETGMAGSGNLYCLDHDLRVMTRIENVSISNGLGWSPTADKMYHIESGRQKVLEYAYESLSGSITSPRMIIEFASSEGSPDGMHVDSEGMLWIALWDGGKVIRLDPKNGERLCEVHTPGVRKVTSCALGGENLSTLFITTARQGFTREDEKNQPNAGSLFSADVGVKGLNASLFRRKLNG